MMNANSSAIKILVGYINKADLTQGVVGGGGVGCLGNSSSLCNLLLYLWALVFIFELSCNDIMSV